MSFNPLMTLLVGAVRPLLPDQANVIELGNQTFNPSDESLQVTIGRIRSAGCATANLEALAALARVPADQRGARTAEFYRCLGFADYDSIDISDKFGSLVMDLNKNLKDTYGFGRTYDLVTNNGTGEHIFNQAVVFENMHALAKRKAILVHVLPMINYVNHGFYSFHPTLFYGIALANAYRLLALGLAHRGGSGIVADLPDAAGNRLSCLIEEERVPLSIMLGKARIRKRGPLALLRRKNKGGEGGSFGHRVQSLTERFGNLLIFAIMQKGVDAPFRTPVQTLYAHDFAAEEMKREYQAPLPAIDGAR